MNTNFTNIRDGKAREGNKEDNLLLKDEVYAVVGAAMEVHNTLGAGFLESVYQEALELELKARGIPFQSQYELPIRYKGNQLSQVFRADIFVYDQIIVELKTVSQIIGAHEAQLLNYMKASGCRVGLLFNFGTSFLEWKRRVL